MFNSENETKTANLMKEMMEQMPQLKGELEALHANCQTLKGDGDYS